MRRALVGAVVVLAVLFGVAGLWWTGLDDASGPRSLEAVGSRSSAAPSPPAPVRPTAPSAATPTAPTLRPRPTCADASRGFAPRAITVPGITRRSAVVAPPRTAYGTPGTPPLTTAGKFMFAWDRAQGVHPGDARGNVLLNTHTWPDGSALGNHLLTKLHVGDRIMVHGDRGSLCYRVTARVEVPAQRSMPRYYRTDGRPRLAIVVCSGRRLAPGVWDHRTVWFASPSV